ncbi:hypothetical protein SNEBB_003409 [Seison nebaliae]|nr:hypothetical protein SNEBB_003409 [Seison nebaliae]
MRREKAKKPKQEFSKEQIETEMKRQVEEEKHNVEQDNFNKYNKCDQEMKHGQEPSDLELEVYRLKRKHKDDPLDKISSLNDDELLPMKVKK